MPENREAAAFDVETQCKEQKAKSPGSRGFFCRPGGNRSPQTIEDWRGLERSFHFIQAIPQAIAQTPRPMSQILRSGYDSKVRSTAGSTQCAASAPANGRPRRPAASPAVRARAPTVRPPGEDPRAPRCATAPAASARTQRSRGRPSPVPWTNVTVYFYSGP